MKVAIQYSSINRRLDFVASAISWIGCKIERFPSYDIGDGDMVVMWGGLETNQKQHRMAHPGQRYLFVENGWLPQEPCWQMDPLGVNALASWAVTPVQIEGGEPLEVKQPAAPVLVILQDDDDSQIIEPALSPAFRSMAQWLRFLANEAPGPMVIRKHPAAEVSAEVQGIVESCERMSWDESKGLDEALAKTAAMLTINSSCGVHALQVGMPLLTFGRSVWSSVTGASYNMLAGPRDLADGVGDALAEIRRGVSSLNAVAQLFALRRILSNQWWPDDQLPMRMEQTLGRYDLIQSWAHKRGRVWYPAAL